MPYAQKNYNQQLGNGPYSIAEAGCFLTAFCNLLERWGEGVDPSVLNNFFIQHSKYVDVDGDRTLDDLAYGTISAYDGQITVDGTGAGGWPDSNDAIVKFQYTSPRSGQLTTHFCLVVDHTNGTIVDSWDGVIKHSPYGNPIGWAKYKRDVPQVVSVPVPAPMAPAFSIENIPERTEELKTDSHLWDMTQLTWPGLVNNPVEGVSKGYQFQTTQIAHHIAGGSYYIPNGRIAVGYNIVDCQIETIKQDLPSTPTKAPDGAMQIDSGRTYTVKFPIKGYITATQAANHVNPTTDITPGDYSVFNEYPNRPDLINVTRTPGMPGSWINLADDVENPVVLAPVVPAVETPAPAIPEVQAPVEELAPVHTWKDDYKPFPATVKYVAVKDIMVSDLSRPNEPAMLLPKYDPKGSSSTVGVIGIYGTVVKDGVSYYRARLDSDTDFEWWYCIPKLDAATHTPLLLVKANTINPKPISRATIAQDRVQLLKSKVEQVADDFLDDIVPKWFKTKK